MILTVSNLKGGTKKTTSAAYMAHTIAELGIKVVVFDGDPQGSITRWAKQAGWSIPVRSMATPTLHVEAAAELAEGGEFDAVVIDTPPMDAHLGIVRSAIKACTHLLIPIAPTPHEYERMAEVRSLVKDASSDNRHQRPPAAAVLLAGVTPGAASTAAHREALEADGWHVLRVVVGHLQRYSQSFGSPITNASRGAYGDALNELLEVEG